MIVLDSSIVNVALPSIQTDLGFSQAALAWVVNAYLLTFGGFLLLSGRLGDLLGNKRVFLGGVVSFTVASVACGFAPSAELLVVGRAVQGLGGAAVSAVALALIMGLFTEPGRAGEGDGRLRLRDVRRRRRRRPPRWGPDRAVLVELDLPGERADRRRPSGSPPAACCPPTGSCPRSPASTSIGAVMVTAALMLSVYAIVGGNEAGWTSARTLGLLGGGLALLIAFVAREARVTNPLVPLRLFALRNVVGLAGRRGCSGPPRCSPGSSWPRSTCRRCWTTDALEVGLAFIPTSVVMAYCSLRVSDRLVMRFGIRPPLTVGLLLAAASLALFSQAPVGGSFVVDVLPSMVLLGRRSGHRLQPGAAGRDGRRGAARVRSRLRASSTPRS